MSLTKRCSAEFLGTLWLVFGGCGSAVIAAAFPNVGIGLLGVSLAFGLTVLTMAYAIGHISGCHLNPAVSVGLWTGKRFPASELLPYIVAQVLGGIAGAWLIEQRVNHARDLLETTTLPVDDVARRAGLGTGASLRQHMRATVGVSPGAYRRTFSG